MTAEDARGWTPLHYACRALAMSESSTSCTAQAGLNLMREGAEDVSIMMHSRLTKPR